MVLTAFKALKAAGARDGATIAVFLNGDEESAGEPVEIARQELIEAGKSSDAIPSFELAISERHNAEERPGNPGFSRRRAKSARS